MPSAPAAPPGDATQLPREAQLIERLTQPLFDIAAYARALERAYAMMYERHRAGLRPDHLYVDA